MKRTKIGRPATGTGKTAHIPTWLLPIVASAKKGEIPILEALRIGTIAPDEAIALLKTLK